MQGVSDLGTEYHFKRVAGEGAASGQLQALLTTVLVVLEVGVGGAHHSITSMGIAEGHRDRPLHLRVAGEMFEAVPADIIGGVANAEHRVQQ
ncbi:hypothetical protein PS723_06574 [Pseudomonas fluorescens]|nr:hypothetical protein PS723_06574 [Pseudomonas fluorescens]